MNFLFSMPNLYKILIFKIYGFTPDWESVRTGKK